MARAARRRAAGGPTCARGSALESDWQVGSPIVERHPDREGFPRALFDIRTFGGCHADSHPRRAARRRVRYPFVRYIGQGWPGILSSLKTLLESGEPLDFPPPFEPKRRASA
ncbi:MAG: hypothetical protein GEU83_08995 [Pseudonocardiaceae bacterium]|nr:hypothetical protein [Pseudonocardiaceae bacterium]